MFLLARPGADPDRILDQLRELHTGLVNIHSESTSPAHLFGIYLALLRPQVKWLDECGA